MIKQFNGFKAEINQAAEKLPAGAYVCKIMKAELVDYTWGSVLLISIDIAEGDYKDFYKNNWNSQTGEDKKWKGTLRMNLPKDDGTESDEWTKRSFNNFIGVVEDANPGYCFDWDETKLKGKTVGVLFRNREWENNGRSGWYTEAFSTAPVGDIKDGKDFKIKDKPLKNKENQNAIPDFNNSQSYEASDDLPF